MEPFDFTIIHEDIHGVKHELELTCDDEEQALEVFSAMFPDNELISNPIQN